MNYLAHIYLSGTNSEVKIGNFIGDYVKGSQYLKYSKNIQRGILLHRKIDGFTDKHPLVRESMEIFRPKYRRYSGVVVDVVYDHILALNWEKYSQKTLKSYVNDTHWLFIRKYFILPRKVRQFLPYLIKSRRLENYNNLEGLQKTLYIMSTHTSLPDYSLWAAEQVAANYNLLEAQFHPFFKELIAMCNLHLDKNALIKPREL